MVVYVHNKAEGGRGGEGNVFSRCGGVAGYREVASGEK